MHAVHGGYGCYNPDTDHYEHGISQINSYSNEFNIA